ncbi:hypothetical protein NA56DRAFT_694504 [Hyaloscypha hepaticicola]|uniref:Uncharacterized protein n=1 Tax=Hyaloscypha hepaticicola TaxID=2082293 RepID=A0A2J6PIB5_9HELO|nr:hypothetical protein NA56DRAFT_694504 [Hyaloscypha hepaticicola]
MQSQNLSFLRKNDPLYGSPQNRQLRKSTAASPPKSAATYRPLQYPQNRQLRKSTAASLPKSITIYRQLPHPLNRRLHKSTAVTTPQNRQLRKSTVASPSRPVATYRQLPHPLNRRLRKSTAVSPQKWSVTQSTTDRPSPVESNTPEALESTVNAFTAITTTAVPHTLAPLTTPLIAEHLEKSSSFTQSIYKTNSLHEIDSLHEINSFEHGYWEVESIVDAFTAITTTAVPHTSTSPTTGQPGKSSVPHTSASLTFKNPAKSTYNANDLHEIDGLHEINCFEHGYWEARTCYVASPN